MLVKKVLFSGILTAVFIMTNCTTLKELPQKKAIDRLRKDIDTILADPRFYHGNIGLMIESLDTGELIFQKNPYKLFMPASNMKLFTAAAALVRLGPEFKFKTELLSSGIVDSEGTLTGDLVIKGSGDPSFGSTYFHSEPAAIFDTWINSLKALGIKRVEGDIFGDDNIFDDSRFGAGWEYGDLQYSYAAPTGGLSYMDNCIRITVIPGMKAGDSANVRIEPDIGLFRIESNISTVEPTRIQGVRSVRNVGERLIQLSGTISTDHSPITRYITVENPTLFSASVFKHLLEKNGIEVSGEGVDLDESNKAATELQQIAAIESPPLHEILNILNKVSHNFFADQLLKTLGKEYHDSGTFTSGIAVLKGFLSSAGIDPTNYFQYDGSGLSRYNLVMPVQILTLLKYMKNHTFSEYFFDSLPVAAVDGTIENRMRNTPAANKVHAKTGTIRWARGLSGYVTSKDGEEFVVAMLINHYINPTSLSSYLQDRLYILLANFERK